MCTFKTGIWLTRLRFGLSGLNYHRFKYNFIESPKCPNCEQVETSAHYFFQCQSYDLARQSFLVNLNVLDSNLDINDHNNLLDIILYGLIDCPLQPTLFDIVSSYMLKQIDSNNLQILDNTIANYSYYHNSFILYCSLLCHLDQG